MKHLRPTDIRKQEDFDLVVKALRKSNGSDYRIEFNPYPIGNLRHDRFERYYRRELNAWRTAEKEFDSLAEVYGEFRPDKMNEDR